jgi:hypothetical protein
MKSSDLFVREFASLHGVSDRPRHPEILDTAFDESDDLEFDSISELIRSASDN